MKKLCISVSDACVVPSKTLSPATSAFRFGFVGIGHYALVAREKDLLLSWPFPERYFHFCLENGIKNVLPPFALCDSGTNLLQREESSDCCQEKRENDVCTEKNDIKIADEEYMKVAHDSKFSEAISKFLTQFYNCSFSSESSKHRQNYHLMSDTIVDTLHRQNYHLMSDTIVDTLVARIQLSSTIPCLHPLVDRSTKVLAAPKRLRHKQQKRKGKPKKRYMADILAVAKHCTLKEMFRVDSLSIDSKSTAENFNEGTLMSLTEHDCKSELAEEEQEKHQSIDKEAVDGKITRKKRLVVKFKLYGSDGN
ncbi:unnamed protein product [Ilex paraguariensis]|uniref:Uncharacterized protein n=1 Tax=Ilex paraguariensis TaxID=185542 RepID=A0ABC8V213_9AQUA